MQTFGKQDILLAKFSASDGRCLWSRSLGSSQPRLRAGALTVQPRGDTFLAVYPFAPGTFDLGGGPCVKDSSAVYRLFRRVPGVANLSLTACKMLFHPSGDLFVQDSFQLARFPAP